MNIPNKISHGALLEVVESRGHMVRYSGGIGYQPNEKFCACSECAQERMNLRTELIENHQSALDYFRKWNCPEATFRAKIRLAFELACQEAKRLLASYKRGANVMNLTTPGSSTPSLFADIQTISNRKIGWFQKPVEVQKFTLKCVCGCLLEFEGTDNVPIRCPRCNTKLVD